ncbi:MAG: ABC transporter permease [Burkholderiales bacterium]
MKPLLLLAARSSWSRRSTLVWVLVCMVLSTSLLLAFERVRSDLRSSFLQAVSGTDLIVGARTGAIPLMLYSVFRVGNATNNINYSSVQALAQHRAVAWVVPISLGDSHRGFPVLGTTRAYFQHFLYGDQQALVIKQGQAFAGTLDGLYEAVVGAEVAEALNYKLGQKITLSHGSGGPLAMEHADKPFTVVGILARTGTPVDRTVHVSLEAIEAIHLDWAGGAPMPGMSIPADQARKFDLTPKQVTAALVGLKSRAAVFNVQRHVNSYETEPLMAVLPGVALDELWSVVGAGEKALLGMSVMVGVVSLLGLIAVVLAGLNERRRELAVLRAVGARPGHLLVLLALEGGLVTLLGVLVGAVLTTLLMAVGAPWLRSHYGVQLRWAEWSGVQMGWVLSIVLAGLFASLWPALRAYRLSLSDGLSPR